jgi:hypothetical protein
MEGNQPLTESGIMTVKMRKVTQNPNLHPISFNNNV